jgi:hypothetical protein
VHIAEQLQDLDLAARDLVDRARHERARLVAEPAQQRGRDVTLVAGPGVQGGHRVPAFGDRGLPVDPRSPRARSSRVRPTSISMLRRAKTAIARSSRSSPAPAPLQTF